jgi:hypothetical protein
LALQILVGFFDQGAQKKKLLPKKMPTKKKKIISLRVAMKIKKDCVRCGWQ